jgi:hypothetical protein
MTAASGWAPPMPPRPAGQDPLAGEIAVIVLAAGLGEGLVGALHDALRADIDPRARRHLAVHHQPLRSSSLKWSQLAHCGTRLELAISTRGASAWVRNTPTGLPDWTSSVSSAFEGLQRGDDAVEVLPGARGPANAAIDHQLVRVLGHVRVQIVHQHPHRRFGEPSCFAVISGRSADRRRAGCGGDRSSVGLPVLQGQQLNSELS